MSQKEFGGLQKSPRCRKIPEIGLSEYSSTFSGIFRGTFLQIPKKTLFETFWDFGPGGPSDSYKCSGRKSKAIFWVGGNRDAGHKLKKNSVREEGKGTRNAYEASKGSKGISGL